MGEARTTLEAVFAETSKDISQLIEQVEAVESKLEGLLTTLPAAAGQLNAQLKPTLDEMYAAIGRLNDGNSSLIRQRKEALDALEKNAASNLQAEGRRILNEIREQLGGAAMLAIGKAFETQHIKQPIADAVNEVHAVAKGLDAALSELTTARGQLVAQTVQINDTLASASKQVSWSIWKRLGAQLGVALLAGVILLALAKVMGFGSMSASQLAQLQASQQEVLQQVAQAAQHGGKRQ
ncbi:hypothetical protein [Burkholderia orbicola]|uniref:hypothetical protein n=1 Tax=Burkholderia orbicola TaxID=2978683 RepID=UPI002FE224D1